MVRFLADENFNNDIMRGVLRRNPEIDLVRIQDIGLTGIEDPEVLEWAAKENRILLSHDVATITKYAYATIAREDEMQKMVTRLMCEVPQRELNLKVPLAVDVGVGSNWDNAKGDE